MPIYVEPVSADFWQLFKEPDGSYLDPMGPKDCMTHVCSRLIVRDREGVRPPNTPGVWSPNGYDIRRHCIDPKTGKPDVTGGVNHGQIAIVAKERYNVTLTKHYDLRFDDFVDLVEETKGAGLSLWYNRIRLSKYRGSTTFSENHELFVSGVDRDRGVFTGVVDPLADGRLVGSTRMFRGPAEYPISLLRMAAGELNVSSRVGDYVKLGTGYCYAITTRATGDYTGLWGADVPANVRAVDPAGARVAAAIRETGWVFGALINQGDLANAMTRAGHKYGQVIDPSDVQWLLDWAASH
jgi:hypothetical protein